jgi:hypothetical protein
VDFVNSESGVFLTTDFEFAPVYVGLKICPAGTNALAITENSSKSSKADFWISFN